MINFEKDFQMTSRVVNDEGFWIVSTFNAYCGWDSAEYFRTIIFKDNKSALENYMIKQASEYFEKTDSKTMDQAIQVHKEKRFLLQNNKIKLNAEKTRRQLADNILIAISELKDKIEFEKIDKELIKEIEKHLLMISTSIGLYKNFQEIQKYKYPKEEN
jgi:cytoplasmic iron level regulating protein YaaA (DUF328/UPF0246 family)